MAKSKGSAKAAPAAPAAPSSNWKALKQALRPGMESPEKVKGTKRKRARSDDGSEAVEPAKSSSSKGKEREEEGEGASTGKANKKELPIASILGNDQAAWQQEVGQYLAIDCEMVGVGPEGVESTLARVSIVNYHGATMLDRFVRPREKVTDYRTWVSGIREEDLRNAPSFAEVQKEVAALIKDRILIGHAISNDTTVLLLSHPWGLTRDTAKYAPLQGLAKTKKPGLKTLAKLVLGVDIQSGEHSSVDDARATMAIYRSQKSAWEDSLRTHSKPTLVTSTTPTLASLDLNAVSTTGVKKSLKPKTLGIAATMRHVRAEQEAERAAAAEFDEDAAEERSRKKARKEEESDLVLGFDYDVAPKVVPAVQATKEKKEKDAKGKGGKKASAGEGIVSKVKKVAGRAFKGDLEKRPRSKEMWWDE